MILSGILKVNPKVGGFQIGSILGPLHPLSKVRGVFSKVDLFSTCEKQPRAEAIACNILKVSGAILTNNSKWASHTWCYFLLLLFCC